MATKSYSKHKEYKEYSSKSSNAPPPYTDEQFDMMKSELIPKGSKLNSLGGSDVGAREYHYEYREEKLPSGKYDRKDLRTVEEYTIPAKPVPKAAESSSYYYTREERELPSITSSGARTYHYENTSSTPVYSKIKSSKVTKDLSHNVEELDSLLDDLQKDQERQLYKSGYTSDTAESSSFDYKRGTPVKAPSSGYSTMKREERVESSSWNSSPPPPVQRTAEVRQELYREEKTGEIINRLQKKEEVLNLTQSRALPSQVSPVLPLPVPAAVCSHCHHTNTATLTRGTPMNKVTTTVKTYTYEVPADQDPTTVPLPLTPNHQHTYLSSSENLLSSTTTTQAAPLPAAAPPGGCKYCSHCNCKIQEYSTTSHLTSTDHEHTNERVVYPTPANITSSPTVHPVEPLNGHGPHGPSYKYSETTYSTSESRERYPLNPPTARHLTPSPAPFPRPSTPSPSNQQPPKRLDDLLADFPEAKFPTQPDGVVRRKVEVSHESSNSNAFKPKDTPSPKVESKNVAGSAVYYPPGYTPFAKKQEITPVGGYSASAMQGGGAHASGRGMYEYESGSKSKEKHSEKKTAVPICLPLCCAMPCVIM